MRHGIFIKMADKAARSVGSGDLPVPMKLFSAWEVEKSSPSCIPRYVFSRCYYPSEAYLCLVVCSLISVLQSLCLSHPFVSTASAVGDCCMPITGQMSLHDANSQILLICRLVHQMHESKHSNEDAHVKVVLNFTE